MTIRGKLLIPVGVQPVALVFVLGLIVSSIVVSRRTLDEDARLGDAAAATKVALQHAEAYYANAVPSAELDKKLNDDLGRLQLNLASDESARLENVTAALKEMGAKKKRNLDIEKEVSSLAAVSKKQSDEYITAVVARLADPKTEKSVSVMEKMVLAGAHTNTCANWAIEKMFCRMATHPEAKEDLLSFLSQCLRNTEEDAKRLKGTPFFGLVTKAREANTRVDALVKEYIANVQAINQRKADCDRELESLASELDRRSLESNARTAATIRSAFVTIAAIVLAMGLVTAVLNTVLAKQIAGSLRATTAMLRDISEGEGDLTRRLPVRGKDEIAELSRWFNVFAEKLQSVIAGLAGNAVSVSNASRELATTAAELHRGASQTTSRSATAAAAVEHMSSNMNGVAAASEQMSANVKAVATAVEQLTASISEVARSAEQAAHVADNAARLAGVSNDSMGHLGTAAEEIDRVIEVIQDIAEQTNLLALNATIEAARAGEAGKGFAVVATEVKELARQTAGATEDIRKRIEGIQASTGQAVKAIADIGEVIKQVNELSRMIAAAVEEQSITTKDIARNVAESSAAAQTVTKGVAESATASQEIGRSMADVDLAARQTADGAAHAKASGQELSRLAEQLQSVVGQFKIDSSAASV